MTHHWDEFSKSLAAESLPRRESLRRLGFVLAGAVLSPLGLETAFAGHHSRPQTDPCKFFCRCRSGKQQNACLAACNDCGKDTSRVCGSCGSYICCRETGPWEYGACIDGSCEYWCDERADYCNGICTFLGADFYNCGSCGNVCADGEVCFDGACVPAGCSGPWVYCPNVHYPEPPYWRPGCAYISYDNYNCGTCGNVCYCVDGVCADNSPSENGGELWY